MVLRTAPPRTGYLKELAVIRFFNYKVVNECLSFRNVLYGHLSVVRCMLLNLFFLQHAMDKLLMLETSCLTITGGQESGTTEMVLQIAEELRRSVSIDRVFCGDCKQAVKSAPSPARMQGIRTSEILCNTVRVKKPDNRSSTERVNV